MFKLAGLIPDLHISRRWSDIKPGEYFLYRGSSPTSKQHVMEKLNLNRAKSICGSIEHHQPRYHNDDPVFGALLPNKRHWCRTCMKVEPEPVEDCSTVWGIFLRQDFLQYVDDKTKVYFDHAQEQGWEPPTAKVSYRVVFAKGRTQNYNKRSVKDIDRMLNLLGKEKDVVRIQISFDFEFRRSYSSRFTYVPEAKP